MIKAFFYPSILLLLLSSCKGESKDRKENEVKQQAIATYSYDNGAGEPIDIVITTPPKRAALLSHFMTEMLLALGLQDHIVLGTTESEILPQFKEAYSKIPHKIVGHHYPITREAFLLLKPDFVSGWDDAIKPETTGTVQELIHSGAHPFVAKSIRTGATLDSVYDDFHQLGKIFGVEKKAEEVVAKLKDKLAKSEANLQDTKGEKPKVLVFSSIENGIYVAGSLTTDLIRRAHGKNVYEDVRNDNELMSYESVADRNPEVIFIAHMAGGMTVKQKIAFLKSHPALKNLSAVKNNRIYEIALEDISPGVRNIDFIIRMNQLLYGKQ